MSPSSSSIVVTKTCVVVVVVTIVVVDPRQPTFGTVLVVVVVETVVVGSPTIPGVADAAAAAAAAASAASVASSHAACSAACRAYSKAFAKVVEATSLSAASIRWSKVSLAKTGVNGTVPLRDGAKPADDAPPGVDMDAAGRRVRESLVWAKAGVAYAASEDAGPKWLRK